MASPSPADEGSHLRDMAVTFIQLLEEYRDANGAPKQNAT